MNTIDTILKRLPGLKSAADFDVALADLETEHAAALAAVAELEAGRESAIFSGADLGKLESDISEAQSRVRTLDVAVGGAERRRTEAVEAERMAELEAVAATARKLNTKLRARLIDFGKAAEMLASHAEAIKELRAEILPANNTVREAGRSDLVAHDPVRGLPEIAGRQVHDPVVGLIIPEYYPRRAEGGPALAKLTK